MRETNDESSPFPSYLKPGPDNLALQWLGKRLELVRGKKKLITVAQAANAEFEQIQTIEKGVFHVNLGRLRDIVRRGYGYSLSNLLAECYEANRAHFDPLETRPFERDCYYALCRRGERGRDPTRFLIGGDPNNYLWATPMRRLKDQPLVTELLELAPSRKRRSSGVTQDNSHDGVEVIYVIHGTIDVHISHHFQGPASRGLRHGDCIHFHSRYVHSVENVEKNTSALLLIVRLPEIPVAGPK